MDLLALSIPWYNKNDLVEVIARSPRAYVRMEAHLLRAAPFEHFARDDVDRLEDAAERLFPLAGGRPPETQPH